MISFHSLSFLSLKVHFQSDLTQKKKKNHTTMTT